MPGIRIIGSIYHITTNIYGRLPIFDSPNMIIALYDSLNYYRYRHTFKLLGFVVMPDHLHLLIWPEGKSSISAIMRDFKKYTAVRLIRQAKVEHKQDWLTAFRDAGEKTGRSTNKIWQDSYWDTIVYSQKMLREKLNYIHRNPVRAGLVKEVGHYPYSSYRNYVNNDHSMILVDTDWL